MIILGVLALCYSCNEFEPEDITSPDLQVEMSSLLAQTPDSFHVLVNPYRIAPLSALALMETQEKCKVKIEVMGAIPVVKEFDTYELSHEVPILGLYANRLNDVILRLETEDGRYALDTLQLQTEALPDDLPRVEILTAQTDKMEPGMNLAGLHVANNGDFRSKPIIFDSQGEIRWFTNLDFLARMHWPIQRFANGNLFFAAFNTIFEYDMVGRQINRWDVPTHFFHHELIEIPNGNFIAAVDKPGTPIMNSNGMVNTVEDHAIEVDRRTGAVVREWDMRQLLDVDRHDLVNGNNDWFHMNAIWFDESDNSLIISGRNQGVVKVSQNNELVWILAPHKGWGKGGWDGNGAETSPYLLNAVDAGGQMYADSIQDGDAVHTDFDWVWGQHAPLILPNGNVFIFDNGFARIYGNSAVNYSRGVEYHIDEAAKTIQQVWEHGTSREESFFSAIISDVDYLPQTGNRFLVAGTVRTGAEPYAKMVEVSYPDGSPVFEAELYLKDANGTGQLTWGQLDIVYRGERMSLYPENQEESLLFP